MGASQTSTSKIRAIETRVAELEAAIAACEADIRELRAHMADVRALPPAPKASKPLRPRLVKLGLVAGGAAGVLALVLTVGLVVGGRMAWRRLRSSAPSASSVSSSRSQALALPAAAAVGSALRRLGYLWLASLAAVARWFAGLAKPRER